MRSSWRSGPLTQYDCCSSKKGSLDTDMITGKTPGEHEGRDQVNMPTGRGTWQTDVYDQKLVQSSGTFSLPTLRRNQPCQYLDLRLRGCETTHLCCWSHSACGTLLERSSKQYRLQGRATLMVISSPLHTHKHTHPHKGIYVICRVCFIIHDIYAYVQCA